MHNAHLKEQIDKQDPSLNLAVRAVNILHQNKPCEFLLLKTVVMKQVLHLR